MSKRSDSIFEDILRLQLRKPRSWNWELSTSKSSPHIPLPVIQLYDNKKNLLIETKANERRSWNAYEFERKKLSNIYEETIDKKRDYLINNSNIVKSENYNRNKLNTNDKIRIKECILKKSQSDLFAKPAKEKIHKSASVNNNDKQSKNEIENSAECKGNKYFFRTCNAGTLLLKEDSVDDKTKKRRRRRHSDLRNILSSSDDDDSKNAAVKDKPRKKSTSTRKSRAAGKQAVHSSVDVTGNHDKQKRTNGFLRTKTNVAEDINESNKLLTNKKSDVLIRKKDTEVTTMGANFSRHSSKGLSGRRCQSISNICNSKDHYDPSREIDAAYKFCNSLPSPNGTACNNNHEHKPVSKKTSLPNREQVIDTGHPHSECHPLQWKFTETQTLCDQGYGSERSPEDEIPPPLSSHGSKEENLSDICDSSYPFIKQENTFEVELVKGSRGLGLSVCGGVDSDGSWPGLLRIKRLFPHQPAASCGLLQVGDLILEANGISLTGLSNYEALEVLRMTPNKVILLVCRPPPEVLCTMSPVSDIPPPPPRRGQSPHISLKMPEDFYDTKFEITLTKIHGSLGFTLCKEEPGVYGHYIRALVREPAISDGRIQPGDKILEVNGTDISSMSHEEAVQFLRQCDTEVHLKLYREADRTPTVDLSPTETTPTSSFRPKPNLRQEAVDMLTDLAARKLCSDSPCTSPRHARRELGLPDIEAHYSETDDDKAVRPCYLDLYNPNQTPVAVRKSKFNLSLAHNAYELNNLDPEMLDAPNLNCAVYVEDMDPRDDYDYPEEPVSMPHLSSSSNVGSFSHKKPTYQSAHPQVEFNSVPKTSVNNNIAQDKCETKAERDLIENDAQILNIELNRGWNSRLGFSLQEVDGCTCVSAVYPDSVAARDGRIKPGDCLLRVNDEMVENMKTSDVIDLLRIIRGPVCITVLRRKTRLD